MDKALALYSAQQTRDLDARAIRDFAIPGHDLMQRAARAAWQCLQRYWPQAERIGFLVGPGNNGGDALEVARLAAAAGSRVQVFLMGDPARYRGEAEQAWRGFCADGLSVCDAAALDVTVCDVWVDGLFGSGLARPVRGLAEQWIAALNASAQPVLALDIPSGLHADSGSVLGQAVRADVCISFIARKQGLYTGQALDCAQALRFDDLGLPADLFQGFAPQAWLIPDRAVAADLPPRARNAHKGMHGHVLLIGGAPGYSGAIRLAAAAALRGGAGLVSVLTHRDSRDVVSQALPEAMVHVAGEDLAQQRALLRKADVLAIGPGLGQSAWAEGLLQAALGFAGPKVLDADALNLLAQSDDRPGRAIITPHPGEAARLLGTDNAKVQADRYAAVRALATRFDCVAVLKGAGSLIADAQGVCQVCAAGNPGMAVAGMGDVLTGLCAALLAQSGPQANLRQTAALAVLAHAQAGDAVARMMGERGMLPSDLIAALPQVLNP